MNISSDTQHDIKQKPAEERAGAPINCFWSGFFEKFWLPIAGVPLDAALLALSFYCAYLLRFHFHPVLSAFPLPAPEAMIPSFGEYLNLLPAVIPLWLIVFFYSAKLYDEPFLPVEDNLVKVIKGCILGTLLAFALSFILKRFSNSRLMLLFVFPISSVFTFVGNAILRSIQAFFIERVVGKPRTLIVGDGKSAELVKSCFDRARHRDCSYASELGKNDLIDCVKQNHINEVVLANSTLNKPDLVDFADKLQAMHVELFIVPGMLELRMGEVQMNSLLGVPMMQIYHTSLSGSNYFSKRIFDLVFCFFVACLGIIPFLLIAALIKLDSKGPVLFKQKRVGHRGQIFNIYKFRTMEAGAEEKLGAIAHLNERAGLVFKMREDPRVTRMGKFLRRFSIDEIPQFINIFKGEMSAVGPRPPLIREYEDYDETAKKRLNVLPGITGLWQVSGRAEIGFEDMLALDFYYIEHWSLGLDLKIIAKTVPAMLHGEGAY